MLVGLDFKEFVIGFLLTTKGTMEEKLDYTFQLYGSYGCSSIGQTCVSIVDIDKDGYIDQSEINVMAKVGLVAMECCLDCVHFLLDCLVRAANVGWRW